MSWSRHIVGWSMVALSASAAMSACGSSDTKKKTRVDYQGAGNAGEAGAPTSGPGGGGGTGPTGGSATAGEPSTAGAPMGDLAGAAGEQGAAGAAGGGNVFHGLYVGLTGDDSSGDGSQQAPFATLSKAASQAQSGDTIVYLPGTYNLPATNAAVTLPDGVDLQGSAPGTTLKTTSGRLLHVVGRTTISDLELNGFNTAILADGSAELRLVDTSCVSCSGGSGGALELTGNATGSITTSAGKQLGSGNSLAFVHGMASLAIEGGLLQDFANAAFTGNAILRVAEQGKLTVSDLDVEGGSQTAISASDTADVTVSGSTFVLAAPGAVGILVRNQAAFRMQNSDFSFDAGVASPYECVRSEENGVGSIELTDVTLHHCSSGINSTIPGQLSLLRTEIYDNSYGGISLNFGAGGSITITDSKIHDSGTYGLLAGGGGGGANVIDLLVRGSTFKGAAEGIRLQGALTSTWDLGTLADAGGNTIMGTTVGLRSLAPASDTVTAIGNTWEVTANTNAAGQFAVVGAGAKLYVTGPADGGKNYNVGYASTLRLAQNP